jgi:hypothetical protein
MLFVCHGCESAGKLWQRDFAEGEAGCDSMVMFLDHVLPADWIQLNNIPAGKKVQQAFLCRQECTGKGRVNVPQVQKILASAGGKR